MQPHFPSVLHLTLRRIAACLVLAGVAISTHAQALDVITSMVNRPIVGKFYHVHSPDILKDSDRTRMWMVGWIDRKTMGNDTIYYMQQVGDEWSAPKPALVKADYELDEPSVVMHPSGKWYLMFYSMVMPPKPGLYKPRADRLALGVAYGVPCSTATDGSGICWKDYSDKAPYIGIGDGREETAASSPSAFFNGNELWLYYKRHGKKSGFMRARIDYANLKIDRQDAVSIQRFEPVAKKWDKEPNSNQGAYSSASVARIGKEYVMVANAGFDNGITRFNSTDGVNFHREIYDNNAAFLHQSNDHLLTPDIVPRGDANSYEVYYGYAPKSSPCSKQFSISGVEFYCSHSIQQVTVFTKKDR